MARDDDPPADAREKAFAALGVGIGASLVTGEAGALATAAQQVAGASISAAGEVGTAAAAAKGASLVTSSVGFGLAKWASIGAAVGVLGLGTVEVVRERSTDAPAVQSATPAGMAAATPELSPRDVTKVNATPSEAPALDPRVTVEPLAPSSCPMRRGYPLLRGSASGQRITPQRRRPSNSPKKWPSSTRCARPCPRKIRIARSRFCRRTRPIPVEDLVARGQAAEDRSPRVKR